MNRVQSHITYSRAMTNTVQICPAWHIVFYLYWKSCHAHTAWPKKQSSQWLQDTGDARGWEGSHIRMCSNTRPLPSWLALVSVLTLILSLIAFTILAQDCWMFCTTSTGLTCGFREDDASPKCIWQAWHMLAKEPATPYMVSNIPSKFLIDHQPIIAGHVKENKETSTRSSDAVRLVACMVRISKELQVSRFSSCRRCVGRHCLFGATIELSLICLCIESSRYLDLWVGWVECHPRVVVICDLWDKR